MNNKIANKLSSKNTKPTSMRILVYDLLSSQQKALSLSEIEARFEHADRITLYRTLKTFEEKGIIHGIQENHTTKYARCSDGCNENTHEDWHLHFYCKLCKETTCKEDVILPKTIEGNFRMDEIRFFAKGICENCLAEGLQ